MITRVRGGHQVEIRSFALTDMVKWGYDGLRGAGTTVNERGMRGVPAIHRAARIRAEALASLKICCYSGEGPDMKPRPNVWQSLLFKSPANEYQTRFGFWETVGESLSYRNNAYIWKTVDPLSGRVLEWYALHPDQVQCKDGRYVVDVRTGFIDPTGRGIARYEVGDETILHIRGHGQGGTQAAPTPVEVFRTALASSIERQRSEVNMWARGTALRLAVTFPPGVNKDQAAEWRQDWKATYEGSDGEATAVLGGGATIQPIGMTAVDAEYVAFAKLTVEDAARIMGVPANLLGVQLERGVPDLEQDLRTWLRFGLGPELERIESALTADFELFGGAQTYPHFETEGFVRGDVLTEDQIAHQQIQDGRLLVDEWRVREGLPPLPGGIGSIPQIVPVGGGPNPNPTNPKPAPASNGSGSY